MNSEVLFLKFFEFIQNQVYTGSKSIEGVDVIKKVIGEALTFDDVLLVPAKSDVLPKDVSDSIYTLMEKTKNNSNFTVNFAIAYGGQSEIIDATKKIIEMVKSDKLNIEDLDEESFKDYLYQKQAPDLIIRTGGDHRTSNFLNYQSAYSEWFFLEKRWPEFNKDDLADIIQQFVSRERRFGK